MSRRKVERGFSLIEALVSLVLAGGAIAALVSAMGSIQRAEAQVLESEKMQRLAREKLDELVATQDMNAQGGDFEDRGEAAYSWTVTNEITSVEGLEKVTVRVTKSADDQAVQTLETLVYLPPEESAARPNE